MSIFSIFKKQVSQAPKAKAEEKLPEVKKVTLPVVDPKALAAATAKADELLRQAESKAREIILEAKDEAFKIKDQFRTEAEKTKQEISNQRIQLERTKAEATELKARLDEREKLTQKQLDAAEKRLEEVKVLRDKHLKALEDVSSLTQKEAEDQILKLVERQATADAAKIIKAKEEKARVEADLKAKEILVEAMFAGATDYVAEYSVSTIKLPDEESKGRIIGKEGRNIRSIERITGVDLDLDEPGAIKLSSFDSVRREIARVTLERLIKDGRIHPTHIEEFYHRTKRDVERLIYQAGEKLCHEVGVYDLPKDLVALLGRFKYRTSYGQNLIAHTLEETKIGIKLAQEIKADVYTVKLGCLLHDIGKVVEGEGSHVELGVKLLKKYNLPQPVINAVAQHHEDEEFSSIESVLVYIADAISGARPGARYENYEEYVERLKKLEEIATSKEGVAEAYAIQAGREVRVIVNPDKIDDAAVVKLAADLRQEIEESMTYPGTVTVNVIREVRGSATAK